MPSTIYQIFREAIQSESQVTCLYRGCYRELCPHIIGHTDAAEKVLAYQFGGESRSGLPPGGDWRCLYLNEVRDVRLRRGPWHSRPSHGSQYCVDDVDLDINIHVRGLR